MASYNIDDKLTFVLNSRPRKSNPTLGWGDLEVKIGDRPVWFRTLPNGDIAGVRWTWSELLSFMACNWSWLFLEEGNPAHLSQKQQVPHLGITFRNNKARLTVPGEPEDITLSRQKTVRKFHLRHDFSTAVAGINLPPLFFLRSGNEYIISSDNRQTIVKAEAVKSLLDQVGGELASWLAPFRNAQSVGSILDAWERRDEQMRADANKVHLLLGMTADEVAELTAGDDNADFWQNSWSPNGLFQQGEVMAAARMSKGFMTIQQQREVLSIIKECPHRETPELDELSAAFDWFGYGHQPHEQGYDLADRLRERIRNVLGPINPEQMIADFNVEMREFQIQDTSIEAIAFWGDHHGPAILINIAPGRKSSHVYGRRFTLCHEFCHLLIDRRRSLNAAEVLGGSTLSFLEQRANAFAAELLLPREAVANRFRGTALDIEDFVEAIRVEFNAPEQTVAWQLLRSSAFSQLNAQDREYLGQIVGGTILE